MRSSSSAAGAATPRACRAQRLIVGPWVHGPMNTTGAPVGLLEFGPNARLDFHTFRQRWYDHHLCRKSKGVEDDPVVWLYLVGPDRWLGCDTWPTPGTVQTPWYLRADRAFATGTTLATGSEDSGGRGVSRYDGQTFTTFTSKDGLAQNEVRSILQDREGYLWFATLGGGVSRYDGKTFSSFNP